MTRCSRARWALRARFATIWEEHTRSFQPSVLVNEVRPKAVLPTVGGALALLLVMYLVPQARAYTEFDHPVVAISLFVLAAAISLAQWRLWNRQRLVHVLCLFDNSLYCLAIVAVMIDTASPVRYAWGLLYAQVAAHYGNRCSFSWPLLIAISVLPAGVTAALAPNDFGLLALTAFGAVMFVVNGTMTSHVRRVERDKERYRSAYEISDRVASESLDIAIAATVAEFGNFAHELRSASTPILGNILILKDHPELHPELQEAVESLERSHHRSAELVEKLLASIKRRAIVKDISFMLQDALRPEVLGQALAPADRGKVAIDGKVPSMEIKGNPDHLTGAIGNLIQNALGAGARRVTVSAALDGGLERAIITLADDGPGISDDAVESLFLPAAGRRGDSHGLGLPLSKRLIEVLGGRLMLVMTSEEGTTFEIVIPGRYSLNRGHTERQAG